MKKKKSGITILIVVIFLMGLSLLLYPTISNYYNSVYQSQIIVEYAQQVGEMEDTVYRELWQAADEHNQALLQRSNRYMLSDELEENYWTMLDVSNTGIMAYIEIPIINATLPVGHGTQEDVLRDSVGHLEWSSLPIGGGSTHCVLSGHRGLPTSELFTNIDHLKLGDRFYIHVLGQTLAYQVDNIAVVEPDDYSLLSIETGKDYITLLTCTPYGVNSHRLLVRGIRVDVGGGSGEAVTPQVGNEVSGIDMKVILKVALGILAVIAFLLVLLSNGRMKRGKGHGGKYEKS